VGDIEIPGIAVYPLQRVITRGGDVLHGMKVTDQGYSGFGEVYFSKIGPGEIKAWKRHTLMTMNLIVIAGHVRFVFCIDLGGPFMIIQADTVNNYKRLTVAPGIWFGFEGFSHETSILVNIADIPHSPTEAERVDINKINFDWKLT